LTKGGRGGFDINDMNGKMKAIDNWAYCLFPIYPFQAASNPDQSMKGAVE
jgi:hypothetical protein